MPWYGYLLLFVSGLFLANGVPHFVLWGFFNLVVGFVLLGCFYPAGDNARIGWVFFAAGALLIAIFLALHFGRVRAQKH
jgi:hypothetical protein